MLFRLQSLSYCTVNDGIRTSNIECGRMSGAEVAGLVLAILPLCVTALEHHRDELRPFKSLFRYHKEIQRSAEDLGVAYVGFVQTVHIIFEEAGIADPDHLDRSK